MSAQGTLKNIWKAIQQLNPDRAVGEAQRPFTLAIVGSSEEEVAAARGFLLGPNPAACELACSLRFVKGYITPLDRAALAEISRADLILATAPAVQDLGRLAGRTVVFDPQNLAPLVRTVLDTSRGADLRLALGSCFPAFRHDVVRRIVRDVSRENAVFVIATALGDVVPSVFTPILGIAEAATDTVVLTANQVRMLFLVGAAYGADVGYVAQWREVASITGAAFGWRTLARNLVSKIPLGGGLVPKGAVAYAGTAAVGEGLIFFYTTGRHMTRKEMSQAFKRTYSDAVGVVRSLVGKVSSVGVALSGKGKAGPE